MKISAPGSNRTQYVLIHASVQGLYKVCIKVQLLGVEVCLPVLYRDRGGNAWMAVTVGKQEVTQAMASCWCDIGAE
jgi:hypothetical protein